MSIFFSFSFSKHWDFIFVAKYLSIILVNKNCNIFHDTRILSKKKNVLGKKIEIQDIKKLCVEGEIIDYKNEKDC